MPKSAAQRTKKAAKSAAEVGYTDWNTFYAEEKERLRDQHPQMSAREIQKKAGEAYQKQKQEALDRFEA
ncbi:hypothetical protein JCM10449v2_003255 [Rhodotorula kratochvilovae]